MGGVRGFEVESIATNPLPPPPPPLPPPPPPPPPPPRTKSTCNCEWFDTTTGVKCPAVFFHAPHLVAHQVGAGHNKWAAFVEKLRLESIGDLK
jgi:hypothetical protein